MEDNRGEDKLTLERIDKMKKYSIVVFVKDRGPRERIQVFLKSWGERFPDSEILVIDSSCSHIYRKMIAQTCKKFKAKYIYLKQPDFRWSKTAAHNLGIREANGKYIITTDIDAYPSLGIKDAMEGVVKRNKNRSLFYSRQKFVREIGFKPYFENDLETIKKAINSEQTSNRTGAKGGLQLASSSWFKKHPYKHRIGWGGMDRELIQRYSGLSLNIHSHDKIWIYHIAHPKYKKMDRTKFLKVRRREEDSLKNKR